MKLNFPNAKPAVKTSLAEKTGSFKFNLPGAKTPAPVASEPAPTDAKPLVLGTKGGGVKAAPDLIETANAIPKVSAEKFNLLTESTPTLSLASAQKFQECVELLESVIDNEGELQNVLKGTLEYLADNPEVDAILTPESRAIFVRAARNSYGITIVAKKTRKAKTKKVDATVDSLMDELGDLDFVL